MALGIDHFQLALPEVVHVTLAMENRLKAAAAHMAAAQVRVGSLLANRATPTLVQVGDRMWLDGVHVAHQLPYKLACKWSGPYEVLGVRGHTVRLNLPASLGKTSDIISLHRLKFYEQRDACFGEDDGPLLPLAVRYRLGIVVDSQIDLSIRNGNTRVLPFLDQQSLS